MANHLRERGGTATTRLPDDLLHRIRAGRPVNGHTTTRRLGTEPAPVTPNRDDGPPPHDNGPYWVWAETEAQDAAETAKALPSVTACPMFEVGIQAEQLAAIRELLSQPSASVVQIRARRQALNR